MKSSTVIMTMPVEVEIVDASATVQDIADVFAHFSSVEERFSRFKPDSELSALNRGILRKEEASDEMKEVLALSEMTHADTHGYFSIMRPDGSIDTSGMVKGWAIRNAARILDVRGFKNFRVEVGGDIELRGRNTEGKPWCVGIRSPFGEKTEVVKVVHLSDRGIATSGSYLRGKHIYNPHDPKAPLEDVVSVTVIGPDVYEADRFATAAFAMGKDGILFIESLPGYEGYQIDTHGTALFTSGFNTYML
jgi:FAD:protein FMN transferase